MTQQSFLSPQWTIRDLPSGMQILANISRENIAQAEADCNAFLDSLQKKPLDESICFQLLEHLRLTYATVVQERAKHYLDKPLPLAAAEELVFQAHVAIAAKMALSYLYCFAKSDVVQNRAHTALLARRSLHYFGSVVVMHQNTRRECPNGLWKEIHACYRRAAEADLDLELVLEAFNANDRATSCTTAYMELLLTEAAGCYNLSQRDQRLMRRWVTETSLWVSLHKLHEEDPWPAWAIDLEEDRVFCAEPENRAQRTLLVLDTTHLVNRLKKLLQQIDKKVAPAQLGLGKDCSAGQCKLLLNHLVRQWTPLPTARRFPRRATSNVALLSFDFAAIHYFVSGKEFNLGGVEVSFQYGYDSMFMSRFQGNPNEELEVRKKNISYTAEEWSVVNESAQGFQLTQTAPKQRFAHGQLVALQPPGSKQFLLAKVTWIRQDKRGGLHCGIRLFNGLPTGVSMRTNSLENDQKYQRAFLFPAIAARQLDESLILPRGTYQHGKILDVLFDGTVRQVFLQRLIEEGADFEHASVVEKSASITTTQFGQSSIYTSTFDEASRIF